MAKSEDDRGSWWRHLLSAAVAGGLARTVASPLERAETQLQLRTVVVPPPVPPHPRAGPKGRCGWLRGLWCGNCLGATKSACETGAKMVAYQETKGNLRTYEHKESWKTQIIAEAVAGAVGATVAQPIESLSIRSEVMRQKYPTKKLSSIFKEMLKKEGAKGFFKGYGVRMMSITPFLAIDLAVYHRAKQYARGITGREELPVLGSVLLGAVSSSTALMATYPLNVMRTLLQTGVAGDGFVSVARALMRSRGLGGFYAGCGAKLVQALAFSCVQYTAYEAINKRLGVRM